jgi:hypothetical protein
MPQPSTLPVAPEAPALLMLHADNAVALHPLDPGEAREVEIDEPIPQGHEVALRSFECYLLARGEPISEYPAPGNMDDGITTLEETSLCAVQESGTVMVADVLDYCERDIAVWKRGVTL